MITLPTLAALPPPPNGRIGWPWTESSAPIAEATYAALPEIGVVVPSYNQAQFLEATLRSLLLQGYPKLRVGVMDGGSNDGSVAIIERYAPWLEFWVSERDAGQSDAIGRGLDRLSYRLGSWLNSDDVLLPGALAAVGGYAVDHPACELLCGHGLGVAEDGLTPQGLCRGRPFTFDELLDFGGGCFLAQPSVFFSRRLFERVGGVRTELHYAMDLDLWLRMRKEAELHCIDRTLSLLRQHGAAKTLRDNEKSMSEVSRLIRAHAAGRPLRTRARARWHMRKLRARSACGSALAAYFEGHRAPATWALARALRANPAIALDPIFARVALRLTLPRPLKARFFARP